MQTKHLCVLIHNWTKGEVGAPWNWFKSSSKIFLLTVPRRCFVCGSFMFFCLVCVMLLCASVYWFLVVTNWERADLLDLVSDVLLWSCHFPLVSWVKCGDDCIDSWSLPSFILLKGQNSFILKMVMLHINNTDSKDPWVCPGMPHSVTFIKAKYLGNHSDPQP